MTDSTKSENFETNNYQDDPSAPVIQNEIIPSDNANQEQEYNKPNNQITINPEIQDNYTTPENNNDNKDDYEDEENFNTDKNDNYNKKRQYRHQYHRQYHHQYHHINLRKCRIILAYILFITPITSILLQLIFWNPNILFLIDDILILGLSSLFIYYYYKKKDFNICIAILTVIIWFVGVIMKGIGLASYKIDAFSIIQFFLIFLRVGIIFCYIPITCS